MRANPYRGLPDFQFWSRGVTRQAPGHLDPMIEDHWIKPHERIATLGSCFAQHLARNMAGLGLNYYVAENAPPGMTSDEARKKNYGVFSARYGNVYTVRQAVQLFQRAFGMFAPCDDVWSVADGGFVDAFRPNIEPAPLEDEATVRRAAQSHLACVRQMFLEANWIVFTLGLTEGWRSLKDGAVYPVAPGVAGGRFDPCSYGFANFSSRMVQEDLATFVDLVESVNPTCRLILTVSPVPLIATYEHQHVLTATTYSKSVLRVAAEEIARERKNVVYFPSYEIITAPGVAGTYYADDLREVKSSGVRHVMRVFNKHFVEPDPQSLHATPVSSVSASRFAQALSSPSNDENSVICDENIIEASVNSIAR